MTFKMPPEDPEWLEKQVTAAGIQTHGIEIHRFFDRQGAIKAIEEAFRENWVQLMVRPHQAALVAYNAVLEHLQDAMSRAETYRNSAEHLAKLRLAPLEDR